MLEEFKKFALRGNVVDLAVGVSIGVAFGAIGSFLAAIWMNALNIISLGPLAIVAAAAGVLLLIGSMLSLSLRGQKAAATANVPVLDTVEEGELALQKAD